PRRPPRRAPPSASRSAGGGGASFKPKYIPAGSFGQFGTSLYPPSPCASSPRPATISAPANISVVITRRMYVSYGVFFFDVVRTFRSAAPRRPEGLHYTR